MTHNLKNSSGFLLLALLLLSLPWSVYGSDDNSIGKIIALRGQATATAQDGGKRTLSVGSEIAVADTIITGQRCRMQILFADSTIVSLGPVSDFVVKEYAWDEKSKQGKMKSRVSEGVFRVLGGSITKSSPQNFTTETPSATIGIRGSMYSGRVREGQLAVVFQGGRGIFVRNSFGQVEVGIPGYGTRLAGPEQPPQEPYLVPAAELEKLDPALAPDFPLLEGSPDETADSTVNPTSEENPPLADQGATEPDPLATDDPAAEPLDPVLETEVLDPTTTLDPTGQEIIATQVPDVSAPTLLASMPTSGISKFGGTTSGTLVSLISPTTENLNGTFKLIANWTNGKFLGGIEDGGKGVGFFLGNISGTSFNSTLFFGNDVTTGPGPILAIDGTTDSSLFLGNPINGVEFAISGSTYQVQTQAIEENWSLNGQGLLNPGIETAQTGTVIWEGFAVGVGEDMSNPEVNRRYFMNMGTADFYLVIDRDAGTLNAGSSMNVNDIMTGGSNAMLSGLQIGGSNPSAYISDRIFAAGLGGGTPVAFSPSANNPLKTYGNYLITEDPGKPQLASYASWGSWEVAYVEPGSGADYHVHVPSSLWVGGERTSPTNVASLIATNFTATYTGGAAGVQIPSAGQMVELTGGATNLFLDFNSAATTPVTGTISFNEVTLNVSSSITDLSAPGFSAYMPPAATSFVNGAFYGPNAESIAGNFYADFGSDRYMGVFGGDR